jgi:hypothetical protein
MAAQHIQPVHKSLTQMNLQDSPCHQRYHRHDRPGHSRCDPRR